MATEFVGKANPLSQQAIDAASARLDVGAAEVWAVLTVETTGCGFLPDRRPKILFERHIFRRQTKGKFDATAPDLSDPSAGGYGAGGAHQYERLARAVALDRRGALCSASWGIGQVMGFNAVSVGFPNVERMVQEMMESEDAQLRGMLEFVRNNGLHRALRDHAWRSFARAYNGPDFEKNNYAKKLDAAFTRFVTNGLPDLRIRAAQVQLTYRGIDPGPIDGRVGNRTRIALQTFQNKVGLPTTGKADDATMAALADTPLELIVTPPAPRRFPMATRRTRGSSPLAKPTIIGIKIKFELNSKNGLRRVLFGLAKSTEGDVVKWEIDFELYERDRRADAYGDPLVKLEVDVDTKLSSKAESAAKNGLTAGQSAHALGPAADDAKAAEAGEIDAADAKETVEATLRKK